MIQALVDIRVGCCHTSPPPPLSQICSRSSTPPAHVSLDQPGLRQVVPKDLISHVFARARFARRASAHPLPGQRFLLWYSAWGACNQGIRTTHVLTKGGAIPYAPEIRCWEQE